MLLIYNNKNSYAIYHNEIFSQTFPISYRWNPELDFYNKLHIILWYNVLRLQAHHNNCKDNNCCCCCADNNNSRLKKVRTRTLNRTVDEVEKIEKNIWKKKIWKKIWKKIIFFFKIEKIIGVSIKLMVFLKSNYKGL